MLFFLSSPLVLVVQGSIELWSLLGSGLADVNMSVHLFN